MDLITELERFRPWNEQEERDLAELLRRLRSGEELYSRENLSAHLTASAWVTSPDRRQVLLAYHNLYDSRKPDGSRHGPRLVRHRLCAERRHQPHDSGLSHCRAHTAQGCD